MTLSEPGRGMNNVNKLADLVRKQGDALLSNWRQQVRQLPSARNLDTPTLNDHIPGLLDELAGALQARSDQTIAEALAEGSSPAHGLQRLREGYDIEEVVAEYNILRGCIHDLAEKNALNLQGDSFHIVNRVLDQAIGLAVQTYAAEQAREIQNRQEEYLAFVAHDLRTPLNAIAVAANILQETLEDAGVREDTARMFETLRRNIRQLQALVEKIVEENTNLRAENGTRLELRQFDLWPLVEGLIYDLRPLSKTQETNLINQVPHHLVICADASLLRRVFQNLIGNAIKYTPRGNVQIGARDCNPDAVVECWVSDNGSGIPQEQLETIFEELESDSMNERGLSLGLAIVKKFVEAHGGYVTVESERGKGTTFRFALPVNAKSEHPDILNTSPP
jgi:two-component system phosphate regulon sensor histidine kinase PhoR